MKIPVLNDPILDREHQDIVLCLIQIKNNPEEAYRNVAAFQQYLLAHTLREEALMVRLDYPLMLEHLRHHGALLSLAKGFILELLAGNAEGLSQKVDHIVELLIEHIYVEDQKFATWKQEQDSRGDI